MNEVPAWTQLLTAPEERTVKRVRALLAASEAAARSVLPNASEQAVLTVFEQVCGRLLVWEPPAADIEEPGGITH